MTDSALYTRLQQLGGPGREDYKLRNLTSVSFYFWVIRQLQISTLLHSHSHLSAPGRYSLLLRSESPPWAQCAVTATLSLTLLSSEKDSFYRRPPQLQRSTIFTNIHSNMSSLPIEIGRILRHNGICNLPDTLLWGIYHYSRPLPQRSAFKSLAIFFLRRQIIGINLTIIIMKRGWWCQNIWHSFSALHV